MAAGSSAYAEDPVSFMINNVASVSAYPKGTGARTEVFQNKQDIEFLGAPMAYRVYGTCI